MISHGERRNRRVGFWLGDTSLAYGGIGPYAFRILDALLAERQQGWQFVILCQSNAREEIAQRLAQHAEFVEINSIPSAPQGINKRPPEACRPGAWIGSLFRKNRRAELFHHYMEQWFGEIQLDLLHFPTQTILHPDLQISYGVTMHEVRALGTSRLSCPYIVTMHDVQELHFPAFFTPQQRAIRAVQYWKALEGASVVIVSFDHVKQDLLKFFGLPSEKVRVCPLPYDRVSLAVPTASASRRYLEKYGGGGPFLLYPAQVWPHKQHRHLLRALREVKGTAVPALRLICTGGTDHPSYRDILDEIEALSLSNSVLFAGIVPEDELRWLYEHTALVTIPTLYEAGSFPLYEAMLLRAPVISSNVTSLPETMGAPQFTFDPGNLAELVQLIVRMLTDDDFRQANRTNSIAQFASLCRLGAGASLYEAYHQSLSSPAFKALSNL